MRIRVATPADGNAMAAIRSSGWRTAYAGLIPDEALAAIPAEATDRYRDVLAAPPDGHRFLVAESDDTVTGFAHIGPYRFDGADHDGAAESDGEVYAIYVDPTRWSRGTGRALMDAAVRWLGEAGRTPIRLWTLTGNPQSRRFYERYGYRVDGARSSLGDEYGNAATVRYTLDSS